MLRLLSAYIFYDHQASTFFATQGKNDGIIIIFHTSHRIIMLYFLPRITHKKRRESTSALIEVCGCKNSTRLL